MVKEDLETAEAVDVSGKPAFGGFHVPIISESEAANNP